MTGPLSTLAMVVADGLAYAALVEDVAADVHDEVFSDLIDDTRFEELEARDLSELADQGIFMARARRMRELDELDGFCDVCRYGVEGSCDERCEL